MIEIGRDGEGLAHGTGLVVCHDVGVGLEGLGRGRRDGIHDVEVAGLHVGVGGIGGGVDLEGHAVIVDLDVALVVGVLDQHDLLVVIPAGELVRAVADRLLAEGLRVLVERFRQRGEALVTDLDREGGVRLVHGDDEGVVVDDLEAGELLVALQAVLLQVVIALDGREEGRTLLGVLRVRGVAPRLGEGFGVHRGAVGELPALLEGDGVFAGVGIRLDGLGDFVLRVALVVEAHQAGEHQFDRAAAASFVGVARDERVLRFGTEGGDDDLAAVGRTGSRR